MIAVLFHTSLLNSTFGLHDDPLTPHPPPLYMIDLFAEEYTRDFVAEPQQRSYKAWGLMWCVDGVRKKTKVAMRVCTVSLQSKQNWLQCSNNNNNNNGCFFLYLHWLYACASHSGSPAWGHINIWQAQREARANGCGPFSTRLNPKATEAVLKRLSALAEIPAGMLPFVFVHGNFALKIVSSTFHLLTTYFFFNILQEASSNLLWRLYAF